MHTIKTGTSAYDKKELRPFIGEFGNIEMVPQIWLSAAIHQDITDKLMDIGAMTKTGKPDWCHRSVWQFIKGAGSIIDRATF